MFVPDLCARDQGLTALCLRVSSAGTRLSAAIGSGCYSAHRGLPVMSVADGRPHRLRFATFEVDAGSRELFRQGRKVKLHEQPFQLLVALLERPGEGLTREELKQRVWPDDTVVDFDRGLNRAINRVRDALGDSAENPRFVETLPRHGYRFIAPVQQLDLTDALPAMDGHTAGVIREPPAGPASRTRTFAGKLALLGAAAVRSVSPPRPHGRPARNGWSHGRRHPRATGRPRLPDADLRRQARPARGRCRHRRCSGPALEPGTLAGSPHCGIARSANPLGRRPTV